MREYESMEHWHRRTKSELEEVSLVIAACAAVALVIVVSVLPW